MTTSLFYLNVSLTSMLEIFIFIYSFLNDSSWLDQAQYYHWLCSWWSCCSVKNTLVIMLLQMNLLLYWKSLQYIVYISFSLSNHITTIMYIDCFPQPQWVCLFNHDSLILPKSVYWSLEARYKTVLDLASPSESHISVDPYQ